MFSKNFWNCFLNQNNMCLVLGPFSKLFEKPMIITPPYHTVYSVVYQMEQTMPMRMTTVNHTLSGAIGSLGCRCNSSSGSVLIRQLTELQLMTCSRSVESAGIPSYSRFKWKVILIRSICPENAQNHLSCHIYD